MDHHLPQPYLKKTLEDVWAQESEYLKKTISSKFRSISDVNMYLFRYWQLCKGDFHPNNLKKLGKYFDLTDESVDQISDHIKKGLSKVVVVNDGEVNDFSSTKKKLVEAFQKRLPRKSSFEL
nr:MULTISPECIES: stealth conserved region 3 domain-containing protein [unclassified Marinobacterium]